MNIILCGFMGSGKTTVGLELAKIMGRKFIDIDEMIEREDGIAIKAIFTVHGEDYFRDLEHECCKKISQFKNCVVSTGGGALTFERNVTALKQGGKIVFLDSDFDVICQRIGDSKSRPLFQDREKAKALYLERRPKYLSAADYVVDGNMSVRKTALEIAEMFR